MAAESELQDSIEGAGAVVAKMYNAAIRDGTIDAFLRQGANEIGAALKAFPDAIQVDEPGAVFNPLYSDIAADRRANQEVSAPEPLPSPSQIAAAGPPQGSVHGDPQPAISESLPSPSEIASNPAPYMPPPDQGNAQAQNPGQDMGRDM